MTDDAACHACPCMRKHQEQVAAGAPGVTHVVFPFGPEGDPDDGREYMRTLRRACALASPGRLRERAPAATALRPCLQIFRGVAVGVLQGAQHASPSVTRKRMVSSTATVLFWKATASPACAGASCCVMSRAVALLALTCCDAA